MEDKKRKREKNPKHKANYSKTKTKRNSSGKGNKRTNRNSGPRLPNSLKKELDRLNPHNQFDGREDDEDGDVASDDEETMDVYEYDDSVVAEEDSRKNRRFDRVDNFEYELPENFKDENVQSDDEEDNEDENQNEDNGHKNQLDSDIEEDDDERHSRMLQGITGMPIEAFKGKKKNAVLSEAYTSGDKLEGDGHVSIEDLLGSLQEKSGYSQLRKRIHQLDRKSAPLQAPLPKVVQDKLERQAAYETSKKDITKWEPLVKRNREAPTIIFDKDADLGFSTVGAIASEFEPRTDFEKKMASLVYDNKVIEAHKEDGARLLELNKISMDEYRNSRNHIAKMRSLLFRHELKMKRVKKIKSKTFRRLSKKDKFKAASNETHMDPEAAKKLAMEQEFKRAKERISLRHKNNSKWARRVKERGLNAQDEGTRAALAEHFQRHNLLTRKMNSMKDDSSSDNSSDQEDDENSADEYQDEESKVLNKAEEKTLKVLEDVDEVPKSGLLSLPFMARGLQKRKEAAMEEAKRALEDYASSLNNSQDKSRAEDTKVGTVSGRRVFGPPRQQSTEQNKNVRFHDNSASDDSEDELKGEDEIDAGIGTADDLQKDVKISSALFNEDSAIHEDSVFRALDNTVGAPGPKTAHEVSIFASGTWKKMSNQNKLDPETKKSPPSTAEPVSQIKSAEDMHEESDEDDVEIVDGILSSAPRRSYELPSQAELIREAFAGDNVEDEFTKEKEEILNEENPEPEKPVLLPGWGQWTHVQKKKGLPSWMLQEHDIAKRKREEALKRRKDAQLKHVIISEKLDKKVEKLHTKTLPYPFTSKEVFEQSMRMPIGPEFNPATAVGALNRPEVIKRQGVIIKPIKFEDVDPHEKTEDHKRSGQKPKQKPKQRVNTRQSKLKPVVAKS